MALRQLQLHCNTCNEVRLHTQEVPNHGPPNITPGFISDSATIIKGMLVLPVTLNGGVMHFTDLEGEIGAPFR